MIAAFVPEQAAIFGELPRFDYGTYTFIANYLPYGHGDAMEHRNSTTLCSKRTLAKAALPLLETASHEFFHVWNVERLRPRSLEPFDFTRANTSGELWFAEGFTNYYDGLVLHRAGLWSLDRYARDLSATVNSVVNSPATRFASPVEMSRRAPLTDRAVWVDPRNDRNTYLSYYTYGNAVALALDLTLRTQTNRTLDDYMRALWERFGREEIPYTNDDLQTVLAEISTEAFANDFFERYVLGLEVADYRSLLEKVGFAVRKSEPGFASLGDAKFVERDNRLVLDQEPLIGHPLYRAGLSRGDGISTFDGEEVTSVEQIKEILDRHKPGDKVSIAYVQRLRERTATITLEEVRKLEVVPTEQTNSTLSASAGRSRDAWLRSKTGAGLGDLCKRCPSCLRILAFDTEFCPYDAESLRIHLKTGDERSSDEN
jgi:predicted metalloprotease with PDZ domain